jgi:hypothetical protein
MEWKHFTQNKIKNTEISFMKNAVNLCTNYGTDKLREIK